MFECWCSSVGVRVLVFEYSSDCIESGCYSSTSDNEVRVEVRDIIRENTTYSHVIRRIAPS